MPMTLRSRSLSEPTMIYDLGRDMLALIANFVVEPEKVELRSDLNNCMHTVALESLYEAINYLTAFMKTCKPFLHAVDRRTWLHTLRSNKPRCEQVSWSAEWQDKHRWEVELKQLAAYRKKCKYKHPSWAAPSARFGWYCNCLQ